MLFEDPNVVLLALCVGWMVGWMHLKEESIAAKQCGT
jgi:hypothetical protein